MKLSLVFFSIGLHLFTFNLFAGYEKSRSGHGQENWVIEEVLNRKQRGYFVDLAAADGLTQSNTYRLEKEFNWQGICIEANPLEYRKLEENRSCTLVNACIDTTNQEVQFVLASLMGGILADDTRVNFKHRKNMVEKALEKDQVITIYTKTLEQVLDEAHAPSIIDYLSLDVEGAELRVLKEFPFEKYTFLTMSVEQPNKELNNLLVNNGYIYMKKVGIDSLYIHQSVRD